MLSGVSDDYSNPTRYYLQTFGSKAPGVGLRFPRHSIRRSGNSLYFLENDSLRQLPRLTEQNPANEATIEARVLWNVLRHLIKLGVMNPAIQLRKENRDQPHSPQPIRCESSRRS